MKNIIITYDPKIVFGKIRITFSDTALTIETKEPMPLSDVAMRTEVDKYHYLYSKKIPLTEAHKEIQQQLYQIDFSALFSEEQEYDGKKRCCSSLEIVWGHYDVCLALSKIERCQNREAIRLHELMKSLFAEINMEEWYASK
jgi:hypothetical protein